MFSLFTFESFVFIAVWDGLSSLKTVRRGICAQWRRPLIALTFAVDNGVCKKMASLSMKSFFIHTINLHMMHGLEFSCSYIWLKGTVASTSLWVSLSSDVLGIRIKDQELFMQRGNIPDGSTSSPPHLLHLYSALSCLNLFSFRISEKKTLFW